MLGYKQLEVAVAGQILASLCVAVLQYFLFIYFWRVQPSLHRSRLETTTLMTPCGRSPLRYVFA